MKRQDMGVKRWESNNRRQEIRVRSKEKTEEEKRRPKKKGGERRRHEKTGNDKRC